MYVKVKTVDGAQTYIISVSKAARVKNFKELVSKKVSVDVSSTRLFFRGKQLEDEFQLIDYDINVNDVVQLLLPTKPPSENDANRGSAHNNFTKLGTFGDDVRPSDGQDEASSSKAESVDVPSQYFKVGDKVDAIEPFFGAWFEATIVNIKDDGIGPASKTEGKSDVDMLNEDERPNNDKLTYYTKFDWCEGDSLPQTIFSVRPRARKFISLSDLNVGDTVFVNYNLDSPHERGYWYDFNVTSVSVKRKRSIVTGNLLMGNSRAMVKGCVLVFPHEIMKIEETLPLTERKDELFSDFPKKREVAAECMHCNDTGTKCKFCGCKICHRKDEAEKLVVCDECQEVFHIGCLTPPMTSLPDDDWYCSECKIDTSSIIKAGDQLKLTKKKSKLVSKVNNTTKDWGKGMACVGRQTVCTIVPSDHIGPIPGVEVGTTWKFRVQVSEAGVHRPHVAGIHGTEAKGAYSIVFSGGYEGDVDSGEEFYYTGSGGRDLSGNKRTACQSSDQVLTRMNKALARCCNAPINNTKGATAKNWEAGQPVRVVRNHKASKHSCFAPPEGNRYDGIYKVVKYWPEKGPSGFLVWRYLLRRDDPSPAPWTPEGEEHMRKFGLNMIYPDGYLEAMEGKEDVGTKKRKSNTPEESQKKIPNKKIKSFKVEAKVMKLLKLDSLNSKMWTRCLEAQSEGQQVFLQAVSDSFICICCQELVCDPVTTDCGHNFCQKCVERSFMAKVYTCPACRGDIKDINLSVNTALQNALTALFPGYSTARLR